MKRNAAQTIFRTVVFAGAMLGTSACKKNPPANTTPTNAAKTDATPATGTTEPTDTAGGGQTTTPTPDPDADPCAGGERPRPNPDGGGGMGRGFILS